MASDSVLYARTGDVATLTLNRPDRRNALSLDVLRQMDRVLTEAGRETDLAALVIRGAGPAFCAGHDLAQLAAADAVAAREVFSACHQVMEKIRTLPCPVIAGVHGFAAAAGCQLVAACDMAVATASSRFSTPGVLLGLFCFTPGVFVSRNLPRKKAFEMLFCGDTITADEARAFGLINQVTDDNGLDAGIDSVVQRLARHSRRVLAAGKAFFYRQLAQDDFTALYTATQAISIEVEAPDAKEGIAAFMEKRPPRWPE